jgi:hypothetical protein
MKTLPYEVILIVASFGLYKDIKQLDKWFNIMIPKEHCIYKLKIFLNDETSVQYGNGNVLKKFINLTYLDCSFTKIIEIPRELVNLTYLYCSRTNINEIPRELVNLTYLDCRYTYISEIPRELVNLTYLHCYNTNISEIPLELTKLKKMYLPKILKHNSN